MKNRLNKFGHKNINENHKDIVKKLESHRKEEI